MSKNTIGRPGPSPMARGPEGGGDDGANGPDAQPQPGATRSAKSSSSSKADKSKGVKAEKQKAPKAARGPGGGHAAEAPGATGGPEAGGGDADGAIDDADEIQHRRTHKHRQAGDAEGVDDALENHEEVQDTGAIGADAIKRSKGDAGGGDGFDQGRNQREAYERYMRGNVANDDARFGELRQKGAKDEFQADRPPAEVEALGTPRASAHVVRLYETWTLAGVARDEAVQKAASFLAGFASVQNIRKVLAELENKPIRDVYPLEVLMRMLDERPELLPGVRKGSVMGPELRDDAKKVLAGHAHTITVPPDVRIKSFALLGGGRPGYEFQPHKDEGKYTLLVDTPGEHTFAVLAAPLQQLGRIQRETAEAILEVFTVVVHAMDKKGEPLTPEQWLARQALEDEEGDEGEEVEEEDGAGAPLAEVELAPNLPVQIRKAMETITRDEASGAGSAAATTYSWDASFYRPGGPVGFDPILHLVVKSAGPFDQAWVRAREALAQKQKEFEPSRAPVTQEDFTAALRRARVR